MGEQVKQIAARRSAGAEWLAAAPPIERQAELFGDPGAGFGKPALGCEPADRFGSEYPDQDADDRATKPSKATPRQP